MFKRDDIVQITDEAHHWFPALLVVSEIKGDWGLMGYCIVVNNDPATPNGQAFIRIKNEQVELVGRAIIVNAPYEDDNE
jgi:hypothetical protein